MNHLVEMHAVLTDEQMTMLEDFLDDNSIVPTILNTEEVDG